jgi:uncharacterized protein (DUF4415 family)
MNQSKSDWKRVKNDPLFTWDGKDENDRPLSKDELQAGIQAYRRQKGRPVGSDKESTTIRFDREILLAFRSGGEGWQTRMNEALKEWLATHSVQH